MVQRATIADIAARLGISKSAVSYALNDQPGVSAVTRERVRQLALELGWFPSSSARALSGSRANVIGLVLSRPVDLLGVEPYFMRFVSGVERVLSAQGMSLLLRVVGDDLEAEMDTYRRWWGERRVDGVILMDERFRDPRVAFVEEIGLPAVILGSPDEAASGREMLSAVWTDHAADVEVVFDYLVSLGHEHIAYVGGPRTFQHERRRRRAITTFARQRGLPQIRTVETGYTGRGAGECTRELLQSDDPPTAIAYASDLMTTTGLGAAAALGVDVPSRLSIVSWDDSILCTISHPPVTALSRDVSGFGQTAARLLLDLVQDGRRTVRRDVTGRLTIRESCCPRS